MRRRILIPAALAVVVLSAVLSVYGAETGGGSDDGARVLPEIILSSETVRSSDGGESAGSGEMAAPSSSEMADSAQASGETADSEQNSSETAAPVLDGAGIEGPPSSEAAESSADSTETDQPESPPEPVAASSGAKSKAETGGGAPRETAPAETGGISKPAVESKPDAKPETESQKEEPKEQEKKPGPLSPEELAAYTEFLNRADVYGFLLSNYEDVLDADYFEVFYDGAGVSEPPSARVQTLFLDAWGLNQPETDIICVSAQSADAVLRARTGRSLRDLAAYGNPFTERFLPNLDGWFAHMHGDTNRFTAEAVSGTRDDGGTVVVESREKLWADGGMEMETPDEADELDINTFSTTFQEREGQTPLIVSNAVTGGLLAWILENGSGMAGGAPVEITMERPPFDGHYLCPDLTETETAVPMALVLRSETENGSSSAREWMEANWDEWMEDARFAAEQGQNHPMLLDQDQRYTYLIDDDSFRGQGVSICDNATGEPVLFVDLFSYLFPDNASAAVSDGTDAQSLRWARLLNGRLYFSNASSLDEARMGGRNAYLTAIDPWKGLLLWRTAPLVCGTANFAVPGPADGSAGVLLCGCGNAEGGGFLYQVGTKSGEILDRTPIGAPPEWIVCANGAAYVHCADRDYVFDVRYG
ncbi:MAG: hypothetical protein IJT94_04870 [Oscillibacter sp.]|nr:hypothetical protein [Oscillibacter sp.]